MAHKKIPGQDWKRQHTCPALRTSAIEALDRDGAHLLAGRKTAQSARPSVSAKTRTPMPVPRSDDCVYVSEHEVHSPGSNRRSMLADKPQYRKTPPTLPRENGCPVSLSPVLGESHSPVLLGKSNATNVSTNHYYRTLSETRDEDEEWSEQNDEDDGHEYDYTRFYSGPRSRPSANIVSAGNLASSSYYRVLENGSRCADTAALDADAREEYGNAYDEIGPKRTSSQHYRTCDTDRGDDSDESDQDFPYSEPRTMTEAEPPRFAAPILPKSASSPALNGGNEKPVPRAKLQKHISASGAVKSVISGSLSPSRKEQAPQSLSQSRKEQAPQSFKPRKLSPGQDVQPALRKQSPLARHHPGHESFDDGDCVEGEEYTYPTIERKALPYFKPRSVSPRTGNPHAALIATAGSATLTPPSNVTQREHHKFCDDADANDVDYVYNEPLDSYSNALPDRLQSDHIYDSGMPPSKPRKPAIVKKPDTARKPPLPSKPGKPWLVNTNHQQQGDNQQHGESDEDDVYYDPPTAFRTETKKNYKILDGQATSWYHGACSRQDAEKLLASHPCGTYLLRDGQKHKGFTLSVSRGAGQCRHFQVYHLDNGTFKLGSFDSCHNNVHQLILFCHQHPINSAGEKLTEPLQLK